MSTTAYHLLEAAAVFLVAFVLVCLTGWFQQQADRHRQRQKPVAGSAIPRESLPLSPGEKRALIEVARGNSHKIAAEHLALSRRTVSNQIGVVYLKKQVNSITQAVVVCLRDGDITLDDIIVPPATDSGAADCVAFVCRYCQWPNSLAQDRCEHCGADNSQPS